jgi:hypothetical protein
MTLSTFIYSLRRAGRPTRSASVGGGRLRRYLARRYLARHRLTEAERDNVRDYYRRNHVQPPAIMTAALDGHPFTVKRPR